MKLSKESMRLYLVTDRSWLGTNDLAVQVRSAICGGATFVQLREKEFCGEALLREAICLREICHSYGVPFVVNDSVDIALAANADGVHLGQDDLAAGLVRKLLGPDKIIGVSAHTVEEAIHAEQCGADYLGVGAVFPTSTKTDAEVLSKETVRAITQAVSIPVVAIGGINKQNLLSLTGTGIHGVAVVSAVCAAPNIQEAAMCLRALSDQMVASQNE